MKYSFYPSPLSLPTRALTLARRGKLKSSWRWHLARRIPLDHWKIDFVLFRLNNIKHFHNTIRVIFSVARSIYCPLRLKNELELFSRMSNFQFASLSKFVSPNYQNRNKINTQKFLLYQVKSKGWRQKLLQWTCFKSLRLPPCFCTVFGSQTAASSKCKRHTSKVFAAMFRINSFIPTLPATQSPSIEAALLPQLLELQRCRWTEFT